MGKHRQFAVALKVHGGLESRPVSEDCRGWDRGVGLEGVSQAWTGLGAGEDVGSTVMDALQPAGNVPDPFFCWARATYLEHGRVKR